MKTKQSKRSKTTSAKPRKTIRPTTKKEQMNREKAEEFWSDPCWREPFRHTGV